MSCRLYVRTSLTRHRSKGRARWSSFRGPAAGRAGDDATAPTQEELTLSPDPGDTERNSTMFVALRDLRFARGRFVSSAPSSPSSPFSSASSAASPAASPPRTSPQCWPCPGDRLVFSAPTDGPTAELLRLAITQQQAAAWSAAPACHRCPAGRHQPDPRRGRRRPGRGRRLRRRARLRRHVARPTTGSSGCPTRPRKPSTSTSGDAVTDRRHRVHRRDGRRRLPGTATPRSCR